MTMKFNKVLGLLMLTVFGASFGMNSSIEWMPEHLRLNPSSLKNEKNLVAHNKKVLVPLVSEAIKIKSPKVAQENPSNSTVELLQRLPLLQLDSLNIEEEKPSRYRQEEQRLQALCDVFEVLKYEKLITTEEYSFLTKDVKQHKNIVMALDAALQSKGLDVYVSGTFWEIISLKANFKEFTPKTLKIVDMFDNKKSKMVYCIKSVTAGLKKNNTMFETVSYKDIVKMCETPKTTPREQSEQTDSGFLGVLLKNHVFDTLTYDEMADMCEIQSTLLRKPKETHSGFLDELFQNDVFDHPDYDDVAQRVKYVLLWLIGLDYLGSVEIHYFSNDQHVKALIEDVIDNQNVSFFDNIIIYARKKEQGLLPEKENLSFAKAIKDLCGIIKNFAKKQPDYVYVYAEELKCIQKCIHALQEWGLVDSEYDEYFTNFAFMSSFVNDVVDHNEMYVFEKCERYISKFDERDLTSEEERELKLTLKKAVACIKKFLDKQEQS